VSPSKTKKKPRPTEITISEAVAWVHWHPEKIRAACEAGNFPPASRHGDDWIISVKRLDRWLAEGEYERTA
jgi:hypothetical protein